MAPRPSPVLEALPAAAGAADPFGAFVERVEDGGAADGPLSGLTLAVKDLADVAGRAPTCGLGRAPGPAPVATAPVLARLLAAGADLVGYATMTPLAYEPSGGNPWQGRPRNPWSAAHISGGSSSGSAVAVAAGLADIALGSDTAGSLRIPAQCCGVTAWKPTNGTVPAEGTMALAPSLDALGFLARSARDLLPLVDLFPAPGAGETPIGTVALAEDLIPSLDPQVAAATTAVAAALRDLDLTIVATDLMPLLAACDGPVLDLLQGEAARAHRAAIASGTLDPVLATRLAKGEAVGEERLAAGRAELARLRTEAVRAAFAGAGAILLPVMRTTTPTVEACEPGGPGFSGRTLYELSALTRFANGLGLPVVAVPAGLDARGLPLAVQLVGRPGADRALIDLADRLQSRTDWHGQRRPPAAPDIAGKSSP